MRCATCGRFMPGHGPTWALKCACVVRAPSAPAEWPCAKCSASEGDLNLPGLFCGDNECGLLALWMAAVGMPAMVAAIRRDKVVGCGTCSSIDECYGDDELARELARYGIDTVAKALKWARDGEEMFLEQGLNQRWGEDDDPQVEMMRDFEQRNREDPL